MAPWLEYTESQIQFMDTTELNQLIRKARDFIEVTNYDMHQGCCINIIKLENAENVHRWAKEELNKRFGKL